MAHVSLAHVALLSHMTVLKALLITGRKQEELPDSGTNAGTDPFCVMGRLAPRYFLLGAPKSGTTYFFEDFARSGSVVNYVPGDGEPAWHAKEPWVFADAFNSTSSGSSGKQRWLQHYPRCSEARFKVAVDCTPGYFGAPAAPANIRTAYYGDLKYKLVFMVFLRNPIARSHSHYYQYLDNGVLNGNFQNCQANQFPATFQDAVTRGMKNEGSVCGCACDNIFHDSFYVASFKRYFQNFKKSQFHIVPFELAVGEPIVQYTWAVLGLPAGIGARSNLVGVGNAKNHHFYASLDQELSADSVAQFRNFMSQRAGAGAIADLLVGSDVNLFHFGGDKSNGGSIASWLSSYWGHEGN